MDTRLLIDKDILPIRITDTVEYAENQMDKYSAVSLPVLEEDSFLGCISQESLLSKERLFSIEQLKDSIIPLPFVDIHTHWFDIIKEMRRFQGSSLAVLASEKYVGLITSKSLLRALAENTSIQMPGTIMVLEIRVYDYMLSRIAQITEERNVKIMCLNVESEKELPYIKLHLKLNTHEIEGISREFERFGFHILETYRDNSPFQEDIMDNYDALMKYLSV